MFRSVGGAIAPHWGGVAGQRSLNNADSADDFLWEPLRNTNIQTVSLVSVIVFVECLLVECCMFNTPWSAIIAVWSFPVKLIVFVRILWRRRGEVVTAAVIRLEGNGWWKDCRCARGTEHWAWWVMSRIINGDRQQVQLCLLRELQQPVKANSQIIGLYIYPSIHQFLSPKDQSLFDYISGSNKTYLGHVTTKSKEKKRGVG